MTETLIHVNAYAFFVLLIVTVSFHRNSDLRSPRDRSVMTLIGLNLGMLVADSLHEVSRGVSEVPYPLFALFTVIIFILPTATTINWLYATRHFLGQEKKLSRVSSILLLSPFAVSAVIALMSLFTGSYYEIAAADNHYVRGPLYILHFLIAYFYLVLAFINILSHRNVLRKDHYYTLLIFAVPPSIVGIIQALFEGAPYTWSALTLSVLMVYMFVLSNQANTDYLTNLFNRREYEQRLQNYVRAANVQKRFGVIFLDLDGFKDINDVYGHKIGDDVLKAMATILKSAFSDQSETVARIGGDEFAVLFPLGENQEAGDFKQRLLEVIEAFNRESFFPFDLKASVSALEYDYSESLGLDAFLKRVDDLLYVHKERTRRS